MNTKMVMQIWKESVRGAVLALALSSASFAQFSSGSTGADGAYLADTSGNFDPANISATCSQCTPGNTNGYNQGTANTAGDNVFNFTTISVNSGVTIRLRTSKLRSQ